MPIPKIVITAALTLAQMGLTMTRKIEGPRLDDLKFTGGDYGASLHDVWGLRRLQGQVFFAEELSEVRRRRKTKGGKYNDYSYYGTWACALAGHEIAGVRRIWFDTHLVYDLSGAGPVTPFDFGATADISEHIAIYLGNETQEPDPRMQATVEAEFGEGSCPAYRGTAYVMFKDIPLEKLGNRIPQVSVEVSSGESFPTSTMTVPGAASSVVLSRDGTLMLLQNTGTGVAYLVDVVAQAIIGTYTLTDTDESGALRADGTVLIVDEAGNDVFAYSIGNPVGALVHEKVLSFTTRDAFVLTDENGTERWGACAGNSKFVFDGSELDVEDLTGVDAMTAGFFNGPDGTIWLLAWEMATPLARVFFIRLTAASIEVVEASGFASTGGEPFAAYYEPLDHFVLQYGSGDFYTIDRATGAVTGSETSPAYPAPSNRAAWYSLPVGAASIWLGFYEVSLADLSVIRSFDPDQWGVSGSPNLTVLFEPIGHALVQWGGIPVRWYYLDRLGTDTVTLGTIAADIADQAGVDDADFSALDQEVQGWSVTRGPAAAKLEPLLDAFDSDIRPHDFGIQGMKRSGVTAGATLATEWFVGAPRYSVTVKQSTELPRALLFDFADMAADQQPNTVRSDRPLDATGAVGEGKIDLTTLVLSVDDARALGDRYFRRRWNERKGYSLALTARALALEPGDVRTLELDGTDVTARCTRLIKGADDVLTSEWVYDHPTLAVLGSAGGAPFDGRVEQTVAAAILSKGFVLDVPLLADADDATPPQVYVLAAPYAAGTWPGAVVYQALDGEYSEEIAAIDSASAATWGTVAEALPAVNPNVWDRVSELTVTLQFGELTGCTEAAALADPSLNLAAIGDSGRWELVQFTEATLTGGTTYTVSGFRRGRRGTEWASELHQAGDQFVLLDTASAQRMGLSEVGSDLSFKAITGGRTTGFPVEVEPFTGATLKPYAPADLTAEKQANGDWLISWVRRTRIGGAWTGGAIIPLGEASEAYELDLGDGVDTVTKSVSGTGIGRASYTWTVAAQTSDVGAEVMAGDLTVAAYQISATVDRGFAAEVMA